jgi:hypothetical protein
LDQTLLTGEIPSTIGNLVNLKAVYVKEQSPEFYDLTIIKLTVFSNVFSRDLSENQLTGEIPSSIGNLVELQEL